MKKLVILEGPDAGGKTTLAHDIVEMFSDRKEQVIASDHGPYKGEAQIWKHYFDSMLPAYSDEAHVLMDRCWLAEPVYGRAYRNGLNRIEFWQKRILEHVASQCETTVIYCLPGLNTCIQTFNKRREQEMLDNEKQLTDVYHGYLDQASGRCTFGKQVIYNYRIDNVKEVLDAIHR